MNLAEERKKVIKVIKQVSSLRVNINGRNNNFRSETTAKNTNFVQNREARQ